MLISRAEMKDLRKRNGAPREVHKVPVAAWGFSEPDPRVGGDAPTFKRILLAVTDSDACMRAAAVAAGLARTSGAEVRVVHFIERLFLGRAGWHSIETADEAKRIISRFRSELEMAVVRVTATTGKARREERAIDILLAAAEFGAGVIVIGTRRKSALRAVLFGSVSHEIIHRSKVPVVVVP